MSHTPDGPGLYGFEARQSDDDVKRDLELIHVVCGKHLFDIEPDDTLGLLVNGAEEHLRECDGLPYLEWYAAQSADDENDDQEVDLGSAVGNPGGAQWASVTRVSDSHWTWHVYARWLWEDIDTDAANTLAEGDANSQRAARVAVASWVREQWDA